MKHKFILVKSKEKGRECKYGDRERRQTIQYNVIKFDFKLFYPSEKSL